LAHECLRNIRRAGFSQLSLPAKKSRPIWPLSQSQSEAWSRNASVWKITSQWLNPRGEQRSSTALTVEPAVFGTWTKASNGRGVVCWATSWIVAVTMRAYIMLCVAFRWLKTLHLSQKYSTHNGELGRRLVTFAWRIFQFAATWRKTR
jgi:hypothetical protein